MHQTSVSGLNLKVNRKFLQKLSVWNCKESCRPRRFDDRLNLCHLENPCEEHRLLVGPRCCRQCSVPDNDNGTTTHRILRRDIRKGRAA